MKKLICVLFLLAASAVAQDMMVIGIFPHYAVGAEWSSTITMDVDGKGKNFAKQDLTTCHYRLEFRENFGNVVHTATFSASADYEFRSNLVKYVVPDFGHGSLVYGSVTILSDCSESYPIKTGELVFSQRLSNGQTNDGTVLYQSYQSDSSTLQDTTKFSYGYAAYNPGPDARAIFVTVYEQSKKATIVKSRLLLTLAGREQRIFMAQDLVPELKTPGLYVVEFSESPYTSLYAAPMYLMLKFNKSGLFSTGEMYTSFIY